ncbi:MAG: YlxR family protein [Mycoplasma sp.]|nr:YlxR family protein [Mycoplasma sp.]
MQINNLRKCIATNKSYEKVKLIRIVKTKDGEIKIDLEQKIDGRGAYILKDKKLSKKLRRNKLLNRAFRVEVDKSVYDELTKILEEY